MFVHDASNFIDHPVIYYFFINFIFLSVIYTLSSLFSSLNNKLIIFHLVNLWQLIWISIWLRHGIDFFLGNMREEGVYIYGEYYVSFKLKTYTYWLMLSNMFMNLFWNYGWLKYWQQKEVDVTQKKITNIEKDTEDDLTKKKLIRLKYTQRTVS